MPPTGRIRELIAAFKAEKIEKPRLYRGLMHHPSWRAPGGRGERGLELGVLKTPEGRILEIFSDAHALKVMEDRGEALSTRRVVLRGHEVFGAMPDVVDRINIDPLSPHTFHFVGDQIPMLRAWASIAALEEALQAPERLEDPVGMLARFEHFHVVVVGDGEPDEQHDFVLAPDSHDRRLAAIFTSEDLALEFIEALGVVERKGQSAQLLVLRQAASALFPKIRAMGLEGMVFNPMTSLPPRALAPGLIDKILERTRT